MIGRRGKKGIKGRGFRRDVQSAGDQAFTLANQRSPRSQCVATRAVLHHVRVRWAVAGYKRLRPSGRPPFWGSFRGKFGCSVAWRVTFFRERLAGEAGWVWIYWAATFSLMRLCPGTRRNGSLKRLKATRTDYTFLLLCSFYPRLNFLGERQAGHQENKQASATSKLLKGS